MRKGRRQRFAKDKVSRAFSNGDDAGIRIVANQARIDRRIGNAQSGALTVSGTAGVETVQTACGPVNAATAAFCVMELTFEVSWLCSAFAPDTTCFGPATQPQRQPVIA